MNRTLTSSPPSAAEILALVTMGVDLQDDTTTAADRLAYFECKADLFARLAAHQHTHAAREAVRRSAGQVRRLRLRDGRWSA
jgi:hypothetical protein